MTAFVRWVREISDGLSTTAKGLWVTSKHIFREPVTVEYPEVNVEATLPPGYRGILQVDMDLCISCKLCETACPIACIVIEDVKGDKTTVLSRTTGKPTPKTRYPTRFDIDIAKCMFCGLCEEPCPTGAIHHTTKFEHATDRVQCLIYKYVRDEDQKLAEEQARILEEKRAAAQAAKERETSSSSGENS